MQGGAEGKRRGDRHLVSLSFAAPELQLETSKRLFNPLVLQPVRLLRLSCPSLMGRPPVTSLPGMNQSCRARCTSRGSAWLGLPGSARTAAPAAPCLLPPPLPRPPSPRTALAPPCAAPAPAPALTPAPAGTQLPAPRPHVRARRVPAARAAECRVRRVPAGAAAQPPARVPSLAGGPRAVPSVRLRLPAHPEGPAQPCEGLRQGRFLRSGRRQGAPGVPELSPLPGETSDCLAPGRRGRGRVSRHVEGPGPRRPVLGDQDQRCGAWWG